MRYRDQLWCMIAQRRAKVNPISPTHEVCFRTVYDMVVARLMTYMEYPLWGSWRVFGVFGGINCSSGLAAL